MRFRKGKLYFSKSKRSFKTFLRTVLYCVVLCFFLKPAIIDQFSTLDTVFNLGRFAFAIVFCILFLLKKKDDKTVLTYFAIFCIALFATFLFKGLYAKVFARYFPAIGCLAFIALYRRRIEEVIPTLVDLYIFFLAINLIMMFIAPNGFIITSYYRRIWFLGNKQNFGTYILPALFYCAIVKDKYPTRWKILIVLAITTAFKSLSLGLIGAILVFLILYFGDALVKKIKPKTFFWIVVAGIFAVIAFSFSYSQLGSLQNLLRTIETPGVSKDITVGARVEMWYSAIRLVVRYPLIGVGVLNSTTWNALTHASVYYEAIDNVYLDVLLTTGLFGFIMYLSLIRNNFKCYNKLWMYKSARVGCYCLFAMCVLGFEVCVYAPVATTVMVYSYAINSDFLISEKNNGNTI